jgi:hypothetical protein
MLRKIFSKGTVRRLPSQSEIKRHGHVIGHKIRGGKGNLVSVKPFWRTITKKK